MGTSGISTIILCGLAAALSGCAAGAVPTTGEPSAAIAAPSKMTFSSPAPSLTAFSVSSPSDGASATIPEIVVSGTGPEGAVVVRDISLAPDDEMDINSQGRWSMTVALDAGPNTLRFRLGNDDSSTITIKVAYASTAPTADPSVVDALGTYLTENFGSPGYETPWWSHIKDWTVENGVVVVITDLNTHDADAASICSAASGYGFEEDSRVTEGAVEIRTLEGSVIWARSGVADPC